MAEGKFRLRPQRVKYSLWQEFRNELLIKNVEQYYAVLTFGILCKLTLKIKQISLLFNSELIRIKFSIHQQSFVMKVSEYSMLEFVYQKKLSNAELQL